MLAVTLNPLGIQAIQRVMTVVATQQIDSVIALLRKDTTRTLVILGIRKRKTMVIHPPHMEVTRTGITGTRQQFKAAI